MADGKLCLVAVVIVLITQVGFEAVEAGSCSTDADCEAKQCCLRYGGLVKWCVKKSDELSEACGGKFLCPECEPPFKCFPHERTLGNLFRFGTGRCYLDRK